MSIDEALELAARTFTITPNNREFWGGTPKCGKRRSKKKATMLYNETTGSGLKEIKCSRR